MENSELIKNFERIRDYMRQFYVYGFRSRSQIGIKNTNDLEIRKEPEVVGIGKD